MTEALEREIRDLRSLFWSDRDPDGRAFAPLADAYRRAGDLRQALDLLKDGLDRHPSFVSGHVVAARVYLDGGLSEESSLAARRALELDEENVEALRTLTQALEAEGDTHGAAEARARLISLDPEVLGPAEEGSPPGDAASEDETGEVEIVEETEVVDITSLAPDVVDVASLAPDVVDIDSLAPDSEGAAAAAGIALLEQDEAEKDEVLDISALAPEAEEETSGDDEEPSLGGDEPLYTRTMADLFARQGLKDRALDVYRHLLLDRPGDSDLLGRIAELESATQVEEVGEEEAEVHARHLAAAGEGGHDVDTPFTWTESEGPETASERPPIGEYFRRMLRWTPADSQPGEGHE